MLFAGRYELLEPLGEGAMGVVHRARHVLLDVEMAIKVLHPQFSADEGFRTRFKREAKIPMTFVHKRSVTLRDFGEGENNALYLAMDLCPGRPLSSVIRATAGLEPSRACQIALQVLEVLSEAHAVNILHRDIKPDNIMVDGASGSDQIKVLDFGIAKLMEGDAGQTNLTAGLAIGTPLYMSPEQAAGEKLDARSDLYSLGVVLFEMLAGEPPFTSDRVQALLMKHLTQPVPETLKQRGIEPELEKIVLTALAKTPEARFQSARDFAVALQGWLEHNKQRPLERTVVDRAVAVAVQVPAPRPMDSAPFKAVRPVQEREAGELDDEGLDSVSMVRPVEEHVRRETSARKDSAAVEESSILQSSILKEEVEQVRLARAAEQVATEPPTQLPRTVRQGLTFLSLPVLALILTSIWLSLAAELPSSLKSLYQTLPGVMGPLTVLPGFSRLAEEASAESPTPAPSVVPVTATPVLATPAPVKVKTPRPRSTAEDNKAPERTPTRPSQEGAVVLVLREYVTDYFVSRRSVVLDGPVPGGGERARVNGEEALVVDGNFSHRLELREGVNEVQVLGSKDQRNTTANLKITVDTLPPKLSFVKPLPNRRVMRPMFPLEFRVAEPNLKQVMVNETLVSGQDGIYRFPLELQAGKNVVLIVAEDQAGHRAHLRDVLLH